MKERARTPTGRTFALLLAWIAVLAAWAHLERGSSTEFSAWRLHSPEGLRVFLRELLLAGLVSFALALPLGWLARSVMSPRASVVAEIRCRCLPALAASLGLTTGLLWYAAGSHFVTASVVQLPAAWLGCTLGCWAASAWAQGWAARALFLLEVCILLALAAAASGLLLSRTLDTTPLALDVPEVTPTEKLRLYESLSTNAPPKLDAEATSTLRLSERDLNVLLSWGLSLGKSRRAALVELRGSDARIAASTPIPGSARYLNVDALGRFTFFSGHLAVHLSRLRLGHVEWPQVFLPTLSWIATLTVNDEARMKPLLARVRAVSLDDEVLSLTYRGNSPNSFVLELFGDASADKLELPRVRDLIVDLVAIADEIPKRGDARLEAIVSHAFAYAKGHPLPGGVVASNRAALLALGIVLGHSRVETLIGEVLDTSTRKTLKRVFPETPLRGRADWTRHFFVSAALTVATSNRVSDATGLFKEEQDSSRGSGFSFADLLADRAGTTFAAAATRDETAARRLQEHVARGFRVDDYFPDPSDLPEGLGETEFTSRYGGVSGKEYRRLTAEIDRRIASCAAYRDAT